MCFDLLLLEFRLDGCRCFLGDSLAGCAGLHFGDESLEIGGAVLQRFDEETDQRQLLRKPLEVRFMRDIFRRREVPDVGRALLQNDHSTVVTHHRQRADDLSHRGFQTIQIGTLLGIAEEAIEGLLDLRQVVLNLSGNLADQQFFLHLTRHLVEQWQLGFWWQRRAGDAGTNPLDHDVDLMRKAAVEVLNISLCALGQQDGGGGFHRQGVVLTRRCLGQEVGDISNGVNQAAVVRLSQFFDHR